MSAALSRADVEEAIRLATLAPSILNIQPWRFVGHDDAIELHADEERCLPVLDPERRAVTLSCGAALLHLALAVAVAGRRPDVQLHPGARISTLLATVRPGVAAPPTADEVRLHAAIPQRRSSRVPYVDEPLAPELVLSLEAAAAVEHATLRVLDAEQSREMARLVHAADEAQRTNAGLREEVARWTGRRTHDGIPDEALGPKPRDPGSSLVRDFAMGQPVPGRGEADFERQPTMAVLLTEGDDVAAWLRAGLAMERVWLEATAAGLSMALLSQPLERTNLRWLARGSMAPLAGGTVTATDRLWPQAVMRIGEGREDGAPTPRRPVSEVLSFAAATNAAAGGT